MIINLRNRAQRVIITSNEWRHFYYSAYMNKKSDCDTWSWEKGIERTGWGRFTLGWILNFSVLSKKLIRSRWPWTTHAITTPTSNFSSFHHIMKYQQHPRESLRAHLTHFNPNKAQYLFFIKRQNFQNFIGLNFSEQKSSIENFNFRYSKIRAKYDFHDVSRNRQFKARWKITTNRMNFGKFKFTKIPESSPAMVFQKFGIHYTHFRFLA